jgi:cobalamin synthase
MPTWLPYGHFISQESSESSSSSWQYNEHKHSQRPSITRVLLTSGSVVYATLHMQWTQLLQALLGMNRDHDSDDTDYFENNIDNDGMLIWIWNCVVPMIILLSFLCCCALISMITTYVLLMKHNTEHYGVRSYDDNRISNNSMIRRWWWIALASPSLSLLFVVPHFIVMVITQPSLQHVTLISSLSTLTSIALMGGSIGLCSTYVFMKTIYASSTRHYH